MYNICLVCDSEKDYKFSDCKITRHFSDDKIEYIDWEKYDAVFILEPFNENALKSWTGHQHLRVFKNVNEIENELSFMKKNIEKEKKYLIKMPDFNSLEKYFAFKVYIEQVYLLNLHGTHRIRKRVCGDFIQYFETLKIKIDDTMSNEYEGVISKERYNELLKNADLNKNPIRKYRYCFVYDYQYFELDKYSFWNDKATLELELKSNQSEVNLPKEIEIIKDVTTDYKYKNNYLASKANENS